VFLVVQELVLINTDSNMHGDKINIKELDWLAAEQCILDK
jgi:hypothetical protein